jgi:autotransporter-associated beta strand protein
MKKITLNGKNICRLVGHALCSSSRVFIFIVSGLLLAGAPAFAVNAQWTGVSDDDFNNPYNWTSDLFNTPSTGTFAGDATTITQPRLTADANLYGLFFQSGGWLLSGNNTLSLGAYGINANPVPASSGNININPNIQLSADQTWNISAGNALNINGNIDGANNLTINGGGIVNLYGNNTNFTGTIMVTGNLGVGNAAALGANTLVINNNGFLSNPNATAVTVTNDVLLNGNWNYKSDQADTTLILAGNITANGNTGHQVGVYSGTLVLAGNLSGEGNFGRGNYNQDGALVLAGDNRGFTGTMTFTPGASSGATIINSSYAFGNSQSVNFASSHVVLDNTSGTAVTIATSNSMQFSYGLNFLGSNDLDLGNGPVTLTNNMIFTVQKGNLAIGSLVSTSTNLSNMTKSGTGNLIINGDFGLNSSLQINGGMMAVKGTYLSGTTAITITNGQLGANGTFSSTLATIGGNAAGFAAYNGDLAVNLGGDKRMLSWGLNNFLTNTTTLLLGNAISANTVDLQNDLNLNNGIRTIQVDRGTGAAKIDAKISGSIGGGGNSALTKTGTGTLELSGNNSYVGATTISAGTLLISGSTVGQDVYTVAANATLGGHGTIGTANKNVTVNGNLNVSGGGALDGIGSLTFNLGSGALDLTNVQTLGFTLGADGISDRLVLGADTTLTLGGGLSLDQFAFSFGDGFTGTGEYTLVVGGIGFLPSFSDLSGTINGGYEATLSLVNGNSLQLTVIPEPSVSLLLGIGVALLVMARVRQRA